LFAISPVRNANAGNVLPASAPVRQKRLSALPKSSTDSNAIAMPALCGAVAVSLQKFADRRQRLAVRTFEPGIKAVSAGLLRPLAGRGFKLAHGLHRDLQELEFQESKQWKYLR
jgi:hypothetical protein